MTDVPFEARIWNTAEVAEYLRMTSAVFLRSTRFAPRFPAPLSIPGHPKWKAQMVVEWALRP